METSRRMMPKGEGSEGGGSGSGKLPEKQDYPKLPVNKEKGFSPEAKEYFNSLKSEVIILQNWLSKISSDYKNILTLQNQGSATAYQESKNGLWNSYREEVLPALRTIRASRRAPSGYEIATINKQLDQSYNALYHQNQRLLFSKKLKPAVEERLKRSTRPQLPAEEYTLHITIPDIPYKFEKSLQNFCLAENFREETKKNAFRLDLWLEKTSTAILTIDNFLRATRLR